MVLATSQVCCLAWCKPGLYSKIKKGKSNACKKEVFMWTKANIDNKLKETRIFWQTRTGETKIHRQMQLKSSVHGFQDLLQDSGRYKVVGTEDDARNRHPPNPSETCIFHYVVYMSGEQYLTARQSVQSVHSRRRSGPEVLYRRIIE